MNYAEEIGKKLLEKNLTISTVESCTGGLLSSALTDIAGSSAYIRLNLVTYANEAKEEILGVVINEEGVVSENCAYQMAKGLCNLTKSDICVSTTGIAGPSGGSAKKPVGLMYSAIYAKNKSEVYKILMPSNTPRIEMKKLFVNEVLKNIYNFIK